MIFFPFFLWIVCFFLLCWDCELGLRHRRAFVRIWRWREKNPNPNFVRVLLEPAHRTSGICFRLVFRFLLGQHGESLDGVHLPVDLGRPCCTLWTLSKPAFRVVAKLGFPYRLEIWSLPLLLFLHFSIFFSLAAGTAFFATHLLVKCIPTFQHFNMHGLVFSSSKKANPPVSGCIQPLHKVIHYTSPKLRMQVLYNSLAEILGGLLYNLSTPTVGSWGDEVSGYLQQLMATAMPDDEGDDGLTLL